MDSLVIETSELVKHYRRFRGGPVRALDSVTIAVEPGSIFGLLGPNGAGKTTLIKILLGVTHPTAGAARLLGRPAGTAAMRRRVGFLPESLRLPDWMRPASYLRFMGQIAGLDRGAARRRASELLALVGLGGESRKLKTFSKGMGQRLGLAQALMADPNVLFLDEPTEGLDPLGRKQVRELLLELRARGKTIFLNSHLLSEVERISDRVMILHRGRILRSGTLAEMAAQRNEYLVAVARDGDDVRAALAPVEHEPTGEGYRVRVADRAQLNMLIDRLRAVPVEIESITPQRASLEETFFEVIREAGQ